MILAIDPSFRGTGLALADEFGNIIRTTKISCPGVCYTSILDNHNACDLICKEIYKFIDGNIDVDVIAEYPVFASRSGSYLAILNGYLSNFLRNCINIRSITWVGPMHCDSFIGNSRHSKTFIVDYCKQHGLVKKKTSHDECTAIIFVKLLLAIWDNRWKNSYFTWNR